jgi:hypothetical protein
MQSNDTNRNDVAPTGEPDKSLIHQAKEKLRSVPPKRWSAEFLRSQLNISPSKAKELMNAIDAEKAKPDVPVNEAAGHVESKVVDFDNFDEVDTPAKVGGDVTPVEPKPASAAASDQIQKRVPPDQVPSTPAAKTPPVQRVTVKRAEGAANQMIIDRREVYDDMTPELKKMAHEIRSMLARETESSLLIHFDIGVMIRQAVEEEGAYGVKAVEQLAAFFGRDPSWLYAHRDVARVFDRKQIEELAQREMANGGHLESGHVLMLSRVKGREDRKEMMKLTFAQSLSIRQLGDQIGGAVLDHGRGYGGRKPVPPKSLLAGLNQVVTAAEAILKRVPIWAASVRQGAVDLEPAKFDDLLQQMVNKAATAVRQLAEQLPAIQAALDEVLKRSKKVLAARGKLPAPESTSTKAKGARRRRKSLPVAHGRRAKAV